MQNIPVLTVQSETLAQAYEQAILAVYNKGIEIKTQYDKPGDPLSKDCTINITITDPTKDPMIHKCFPGGIADLKEYYYELLGMKNNWTKNINDPNDHRWEYTYNGRLTSYGSWKESDKKVGHFDINQIEKLIEKLVKQPYSRQAQAITWMPNLDLDCFDPPCLQSLWCRVLVDENQVHWLNSNIRFRSNDAFGAYMMNSFGFVMYLQTIANEIAKRKGVEVKVGRLNWQADSFHVYGKDIANLQKLLISKIEKSLPFEKRVMNFNDEIVQEMWTECEASITQKINEMNNKYKGA